MKTKPLKGYYGSVGCEVYDIDLANAEPDEILELGKLVEDQLTVFINRKSCKGVTSQRFYDVQNVWGDPSVGEVHRRVIDGRLSGPHWERLKATLTAALSRDVGIKHNIGAAEISFEKSGMFNSGELGWHADMVGHIGTPRFVGLHSVSGSKGSRTDFLQTFDMWERLSGAMQSELKELTVNHKFRTRRVFDGVTQAQQEVPRYNMASLEGLQTPLVSQTRSGRPGIHWPTNTFNGFAEMSELESWKLYAELSEKIYDPRWTYQHEWKDGQVMYFEQEISAHRRMTLRSDSPDRRMIRVPSYLNKLYNDGEPNVRSLYKGKEIKMDEFIAMCDEQRKKEYLLDEGKGKA
jgi:alpha-ketoglutarate-dependent taurine dioxygenase